LQTKRRPTNRRRHNWGPYSSSHWSLANEGPLAREAFHAHSVAATESSCSFIKAPRDDVRGSAASTFPFDVGNIVVRQVGSLADLFLDPPQTVANIGARIDAVIADDDMYEAGEPRPSPEAAAKAKELVKSAGRAGRKLPRPEVSVYFGEIDVTWRVQNRFLRLIVFSDPARSALLYSQTDNGEALTRGESVEVSGADDLSQKLALLLG
jgi:hypothetical protein